MQLVKYRALRRRPEANFTPNIEHEQMNLRLLIRVRDQMRQAPASHVPTPFDVRHPAEHIDRNEVGRVTREARSRPQNPDGRRAGATTQRG